MNPIVLILPLLFVLPKHVEEGKTRHLRDSRGQQVFVIDADRREWQGRLLTVSADALTIDSPEGSRQFRLTDVKRVDSDGDSVRDGAIKGAVFGALMGAMLAEYGGSKMILRGALVYGGIGMGLDALNRCKQTVYRAPAPQVALSVKW